MIAENSEQKELAETQYKSNILVVDDDKTHAEAIAEAIERMGHVCYVTTTANECLSVIKQGNIDIVVTDLIMKEIDGLEIMKRSKQALPDVEVILITGYGTVETAVDAMQKGAATFLLKPLNVSQLRSVVDKIVEKQRLARKNIELQEQLDERFGFSGIIGNSSKMIRVFDTVKQVSNTSATVLITGESGVGKELIAHSIHHNSSRKDLPFVVLHTSAISQSLIESELFGHEKGAFTGALSSRKGKFEYANNGSLFLDELGDMCLSTQAKLLRVIENGKVTRLGSNTTIDIDVRIIAATNKNLEELVKKGEFREDLYYRINVVSIKLPSLKERKEDIPLLIDAFINEFSKSHGRKIKEISVDTRKILYRYPWPGNVRELRNCIESMVVVNRSGSLNNEDIPDHIYSDDSFTPPDSNVFAGMSLAETEKQLIKSTLASTGGKREETAKLLGIGERTLYRKLNIYNLK